MGEKNTPLVFSVTGSPSWMLTQAAKGSFTYVHSWSKSKAKEFDLEAGIMLMKEAKGFVVDLDGNHITGSEHIGLFIAGIDFDFIT